MQSREAIAEQPLFSIQSTTGEHCFPASGYREIRSEIEKHVAVDIREGCPGLVGQIRFEFTKPFLDSARFCQEDCSIHRMHRIKVISRCILVMKKSSMKASLEFQTSYIIMTEPRS